MSGRQQNVWIDLYVMLKTKLENLKILISINVTFFQKKLLNVWNIFG